MYQFAFMSHQQAWFECLWVLRHIKRWRSMYHKSECLKVINQTNKLIKYILFLYPETSVFTRPVLNWELLDSLDLHTEIWLISCPPSLSTLGSVLHLEESYANGVGTLAPIAILHPTLPSPPTIAPWIPFGLEAYTWTWQFTSKKRPTQTMDVGSEQSVWEL